MIGRTLKRNPGCAVLAGLICEFLDQPRFANTSLATEQYDLALARLRLRPAPAEDTQLVFPTGYPRRNALSVALQEYGRMIKTIFILRYLEDEQYRRRIETQLNKGEALHALREFLFFANKGTIRRKQEEEQTNQAGCLHLLTNAVVVWNTVHMAAAIEQLKREGYLVLEEDIAHLSPARYEHINP